MPIAFLIIAIIIVLDVIYVKNYKAIRNFKYKMEIRKNDEFYLREIETQYSPSIISYLYNQKIEPKKDLVADILNLYAKKVIDIVKDDNEGYILTFNKNINSLTENDEYIIDTIILKNRDFKYEEWLEKIKAIYRNKVNIKEHKCNKILTEKEEMINYILKPFLIITIYTIIALILKKYLGLLTILIITLIVVTAIVIIAAIKVNSKRDENIDMHLTKEAKEELKKWMKLENYIKSYTLLKNRKFEEIELFEQYIPYAMVLNINKKYKEEMIRILGKEEVKIFIDSVNKYKRINNIFVQYM